MNTYEMMKTVIENRKDKNILTEKYIQQTQQKLDVFLANDRITAEQYDILIQLLK